MPVKPRTPCRHRGCPATVTTAQQGFCDTHEQGRKWRDERDKAAHERGYDATWHKLRAMFLRQNPVCTCGRIATVAHHVLPLDKGGERLDMENLAPMSIGIRPSGQ